MEKISIQSTSYRISLYAKGTVGVTGNAAKPQNGAGKSALPHADPKSADDGAGGSKPVARSQDGDTFTFSVEARTIQVARSLTLESSDPAGFGSRAESDRLTSDGKVKALMDLLDQMADHRAQGHARGGHRGPHFPQLGDPEDVATRMLDHWGREHAERGGSRRDFADILRGRLDKWTSGGAESSSRTTMVVREFRAEVSIKVSAGIEAWASGEPETPVAEA